MPINLSNLSAEDAATTARRAHEERERREVEEWQKRQEEERKEVVAQKVEEEQQEAAARKAEAEQWDRLAQEKAAQEVATAEEQRQSLPKGLSGLTLTIPAPSSIARTASGSLTQSKGKRKVTEEDLSASQYVLFIQLLSIADFFWRSRFPSCDSCTIASILCSTEL
jgi:hypothetical protein